jgi:hypothetical protein
LLSSMHKLSVLAKHKKNTALDKQIYYILDKKKNMLYACMQLLSFN